MATLQDMLTRTNEAIEHAERRLARDREFASLLAKLVGVLPPLNQYQGIHPHAYQADVKLDLEAETYPAVRMLIDALPPIPPVKHSDGCTSFVPADAAPAEGSEPVFPVWVRCHNAVGAEVSACWYTRLPDGTRAQVEATVKGGWEWARWTGTRRVAGGAVYLADARLFHRFNTGLRVQWWRPPDANVEATVYWPATATPDEVFARSDRERQVG
jgi:hypothetical protein